MPQHSRRSRFLLLACCLPAISPAVPLRAQTAVRLEPYRADIRIEGIFQGELMPPWAGELELSDTSLAGLPGLRVHQVSRQATGGTFTTDAVWLPRDTAVLAASWDNLGREPSRCSVAVKRGELIADAGGGTVHMPVQGHPVPDFALGVLLASVPLAAGDSIHLTIFRCLPQFNPQPLQLQQFVGVVSEAAQQRGGGPTEPAWEVSGGPGSYHAWIAMRDRRVLRLELPQGTVGTQIELYQAERAPR